MKNPSHKTQIENFARRIFSKNSQDLINAYNTAINMNNGKGYLIVDLTAIPTTNII